MKNILTKLICCAALTLLASVGEAAAQSTVALRAIGNGEKVRLTVAGKSKTVNLENDFGSDFTAGGDSPYRYTTLLSVKKGASFYLIAKFISGAAIHGRNAPCSGDVPVTLLLIQTDRNLAVEKVQTEIYQSCAYNGSGRELRGRLHTTSSKVWLAFDEGSKKYLLTFDAGESEKGLQLVQR